MARQHQTFLRQILDLLDLNCFAVLVQSKSCYVPKEICCHFPNLHDFLLLRFPLLLIVLASRLLQADELAETRLKCFSPKLKTCYVFLRLRYVVRLVKN
jgi:hypothetical protein